MQSVVTVFIPLFPSQTCVYSIGHLYTLQITAKAARLQHAQPGGAAAGKELLAATVAHMAKVLGDTHPQTDKYRQVLTEME